MTSVEFARSPSGEDPRSLREAAEHAQKRVESMQASFGNHFRSVIQAKEALREIERRTMDIVHQGVTYLDRARSLLVDQKRTDLPRALSVVDTVRQERDHDLFTGDWKAVADFHRKIADFLRKRAEEREDWTDHEIRSQVRSLIEQTPKGSYVLRHFEADVMDMIGKEFDPARHESLKRSVYSRLEQDESVTNKLLLFSEARNTMDVIRALCAPIQEMTPLSPQSISGILGHVLSEENMKLVFQGNTRPIEELPPCGVRIVFADGEHTFYHKAPGQKIPEESLALLSGDMPRHILLVHYRTDRDMLHLLKDMSDGEKIIAPRRGSIDDMIEIEGCSRNEDCLLHRKPPDLTLEQVLQSPMRYLDHHIVLEYPGKGKGHEFQHQPSGAAQSGRAQEHAVSEEGNNTSVPDS